MLFSKDSHSQKDLNLTQAIVGTGAFGIFGACVGVCAAAYRDVPNRAVVPAATLNMMGIGAVFLVGRDSLLREQRERNRETGLFDGVERDADVMFASVVSGGIAGALTTLLGQGPRAVPLATLTCMAVAGLGQYAATRFHHYRHDQILNEMAGTPTRSGWSNFIPTTSRLWSLLPIQKLSETEVLGYLEEEKYRIDRELTLLDEVETFGEESVPDKPTHS
ncbi:MAG: hypothetical protein DHS80DRAFT_23406 [Piptocephalis tieghemiana]|nr:MAG: hypothetical protein DHS80DRAFT_23406 [Piptocephalis tieghemiana]